MTAILHIWHCVGYAHYLQSRDDVKSVLHPALKSFPHHALFKRDFTGSSGLFAFVMHKTDEQTIERFINNLQLFGIGFSWGGFESLVMPCLKDNLQRYCNSYIAPDDMVIRLHIGLEDSGDLINDLANAFSTMYV